MKKTKGSRSVIKVYDYSQEILFLRKHFQSRPNLQSLRTIDLYREDIDQFIWLIRPEPKFRALAPAISRLKAS